MTEKKAVEKGRTKSIIGVPEVARRAVRRSHLQDILSNGTVAAAVMVFAAILAVIVANSPAYETIEHLLEVNVVVTAGKFYADMTIEQFINDFLMAIFFLLVGIELKYEVTVGQLRRPRQAALPMLAAVGGVAVPALIYSAINWGGALEGWAVPIATDIAFALGVMSLLGKRVAPGTKVFFSTLAIADDILAIAVIAIFYGQTPNVAWLAAALGVILILACINRARVYASYPYAIVGLLLWFCMFNSGIHATLAGVILAFFLPARSEIRLGRLTKWLTSQAHDLEQAYDEESHVLGQHDFTESAVYVERVMHHVTPPLQRMERYISVPVNFIILPLFAFANAQVRIVGADLGAIVTDPVSMGAAAGAVLGKPIGIIGVTFILVKSGIFKLPRGVDWRQIIAVGIMGGLGFTMSILIAGLAFEDPGQVLAAKVAILSGSVVAAVAGLAFVALFCEERGHSRRRG